MIFLFIYNDLKKECGDKCTEHLIDVYGWSGSISVITAYALTSMDSDNLLLIDVLNLYGSLAIGILCYRAKVWQAASLEVAWFCVGTFSMIKNIISEEETIVRCH